MATFLVFEPQDGVRSQANAERVVFLREKFSPWAFIFTPFWLLRYRLWIAFLLWAVAFGTIALVGDLIGFGPYAAIAASFFPSLIFGFEATHLRARKLVRSGYRDAGVVIAEDIETAELKFFDTWRSAPLHSEHSPAPNAVAPTFPDTKNPTVSPERSVIGMFPTSGQR